MFIPRTLSETGIGPSATLWRAVGVGAVVAIALFLILSANITLGQENLEAGQVAERDIRAPRDATFDSVSETEAAREGGGRGVQPVTELLEPPADNQADQLNAFDVRARRVTRILDLRDAGALAAEDVGARLATDAPEISLAAPRPGRRNVGAALGGGGGRRAQRRRVDACGLGSRGRAARRAQIGARPHHQRPRRRREGPRG